MPVLLEGEMGEREALIVARALRQWRAETLAEYSSENMGDAFWECLELLPEEMQTAVRHKAEDDVLRWPPGLREEAGGDG